MDRQLGGEGAVGIQGGRSVPGLSDSVGEAAA